MCTIIFAYKMHAKYDLIYLGNRDEFFNRETVPAQFYDNILMGKDLLKGGTWLGINKKGRFSFVTNYRDFSLLKTLSSSRGELVTTYLAGNISNSNYGKMLASQSQRYNPFNIIYGDLNEVTYFNNILGERKELEPGIYGLSNGFLHDHWYKVEKAKAHLKALMKAEAVAVENLFTILNDKEIASDSKLPDTGIEIDLERKLSAMHVEFDGYGTVFKNVLLIDKNKKVTYVEKNRSDNFKSSNRIEFIIEADPI